MTDNVVSANYVSRSTLAIHGHTASGEQVTVMLDVAELKRALDPTAGACQTCGKRILNYAEKVRRHGGLADFCSQGCFDAGTVTT